MLEDLKKALPPEKDVVFSFYMMRHGDINEGLEKIERKYKPYLCHGDGADKRTKNEKVLTPAGFNHVTNCFEWQMKHFAIDRYFSAPGAECQETANLIRRLKNSQGKVEISSELNYTPYFDDLIYEVVYKTFWDLANKAAHNELCGATFHGDIAAEEEQRFAIAAKYATIELWKDKNFNLYRTCNNGIKNWIKKTALENYGQGIKNDGKFSVLAVSYSPLIESLAIQEESSMIHWGGGTIKYTVVCDGKNAYLIASEIMYPVCYRAL